MTRRRVGPVDLWVEEGGRGTPVLILLHGLGANAATWRGMLPLIALGWRGRWIAPDLRGHGRSGRASPCGYADHAADIAALIGEEGDVVLVGHSMGGVVAMALAAGAMAGRVRHLVAFGVKLFWTAEETAKLQSLSTAPVRWFERREEAIERYLRASGLMGLLDPASAEAAVGIVEEAGRFRLAAGPWVYEVVGPPVEDFARAVKAPLRLAAGANDAMVTGEEMRRFDPAAVVWDGLGHNAHVEAPACVWQTISSIILPEKS